MTTAVDNAKHDTVPASLRQAWQDNHLVPLWESPTAHKLDIQREQPHIWPWAATRPILTKTAEIQSPKVVERRVLSMVSPFSKSAQEEFTSGTVCATLQTLLPGERARPHRHSMNALRFVMEGSGAATIVDGKDCPMEVGDLIITPSWCWHEHYHNGQGPTIWMDVLDVSLNLYLGTDEFQPGPVVDLPVQVNDQVFSTANILPCMDSGERPYSPVFRYPWAAARQALQAVPVGPDHARRVRYVNPLNGESAMSTLDCYLTGLQPGVPTRPFKTTANTVCCVVQGSGVSKVGDRSISWTQHDVFTLPQNHWISHRSDDSNATIFMVTDRDVYRKLGLLHETYQD
jgi:gentisate 1,2-dioxygenase